MEQLLTNVPYFGIYSLIPLAILIPITFYLVWSRITNRTRSGNLLNGELMYEPIQQRWDGDAHVCAAHKRVMLPYTGNGHGCDDCAVERQSRNGYKARPVSEILRPSWERGQL